MKQNYYSVLNYEKLALSEYKKEHISKANMI